MGLAGAAALAGCAPEAPGKDKGVAAAELSLPNSACLVRMAHLCRNRGQADPLVHTLRRGVLNGCNHLRARQQHQKHRYSEHQKQPQRKYNVYRMPSFHSSRLKTVISGITLEAKIL